MLLFVCVYVCVCACVLCVVCCVDLAMMKIQAVGDPRIGDNAVYDSKCLEVFSVALHNLVNLGFVPCWNIIWSRCFFFFLYQDQKYTYTERRDTLGTLRIEKAANQRWEFKRNIVHPLVFPGELLKIAFFFFVFFLFSKS